MTAKPLPPPNYYVPEVLTARVLWVIQDPATRTRLQRLLAGTPSLVRPFGEPLPGHIFDEVIADRPRTIEEHDYLLETVQRHTPGKAVLYL